IDLAVVGDAQGALEMDFRQCLLVNLRESDNQSLAFAVAFKREHCLAFYSLVQNAFHHLPSRTTLTTLRIARSGASFSCRISSANCVGRRRIIACRSLETLPASASSTSGSSPRSAASFTIVASEGGGTSPRSTLLRYAGSTPTRRAT